uniref:Mediator of RNA polymerase II transcription subunit 14 n=1 Tax=Ananas comosus var. bracteatus TaxID=296719 RepID=A0A6V7PFM8_ANACO|nr:unnamed protein product [Ananas comosus var. bracteatus]
MLGQQTVELSGLVRRAAEESYLALKELVDKSKADEQRSDAEKKVDLLKFVVRTRQRMLRLHVLAKWCQQVPLVHYCQQLAATLSSHDTCFTQTADSLFYMHEGLQQARAPLFDVPSAVEVLLTNGYQRLPKCIEDLGMQSTLSADEQKPALKKLDTLVRSKLLEAVIPKEVSEVTISDGIATLRVDGEFKVLLTLGYRGHLTLWRILHLELLVGEKRGPVKLEETQRYPLGDDLERRMASAENPFTILYTILHELCVAIVMDTVIRQVQVLRQGRWKDAIRFELISDGHAGGNTAILQLGQDGELESTGLRTPGLKITYWLDLDKNNSDSSPFIKIEPGQDMQIKCLHSSFVLDPLTDKEANFSLDQSCIDVEKLLLKAIACNRHTRLLEIQRELNKNVQICRAPSDVILKHEATEFEIDSRKKEDKQNIDEYFRDEILQVRAYGRSYITLGINIRNGHFLLQSSKNILSPSALSECEEALNQGTTTATEVFMSLRTKSILHQFASIGRFLGLKVYDQSLNTLKIPKSILYGSDLLLMAFPQCGNSYYLLMQLDKDFKPVFYLLETQPDPGGKSQSASDINQAIRFSKIDVGQMQISRNELSMSLFDWEKLQRLRNVESSNQILENGLLPERGMESRLQLPGYSKSTFSSVVDEVFEYEKGASRPNNHLSTSYSMPSFPQVGSLSYSPQGVAPAIGSSRSEGGLQHSPVNNAAKTSPGLLSSGGYLSTNMRGSLQNGAINALSASSSMRNSSIQKLASSKSGQDLSSLRSPKELSNIDGSRSHQLMPPQRSTGAQISVKSSYPNISKSTLASSLVESTAGQIAEFGNSSTPSFGSVGKLEKSSTKRSLSQLLLHISSLPVQSKRRKVSESVKSLSPALQLFSSVPTATTNGFTYGNLLAEGNHSMTPNIFVSLLLHVVRHCSLCIKHAQLTSQMEALDIPYVEEVGLRTPSSSLWLRLPFARDDSWKHICLRLGKAGTMSWDVKINDPHFKELWELHRGSKSTAWGSGVRIANTSEMDSHIHYDSDGVVLTYKTVEADSIQRLVSDLKRLSNARLFACGMRRLIGVRGEDKIEDSQTSSEAKISSVTKGASDAVDRLSEQMRKTFKIEAVGLMSLWFSYGSMPMVHFVVEWEAGREGCTMHVSPDQLWPHTKFLEDFVNGGEVASFLDCIRLTAGPLLALGGAIRPARMTVTVSAGYNPFNKQNTVMPSQGLLTSCSSSNNAQPASSNPTTTAGMMAQLSNHSLHAAAMLSAAGRGGPGLVPSSLLPFDVSVVWLQPATPPKEGPSAGGSLPCPQFRPFIMEHVAQGLNALEPGFVGASNTNPSSGAQLSAPNPNRMNVPTTVGMTRPTSSVVANQVPGGLNRVTNAVLASSGLASGISAVPVRLSPGTGLPVHMKGELNTAFIGLGDDGGYGGGWVPLAALKKVLRGILKYLGVLWLFAQLPGLLKEILGSILKDNEGALLNLDQEQPALRFFVGGYVFAVSVHRVQLLLQVLSVKRFHHQQPQQQQQAQNNTQEELAAGEINEICDYFSRRVASEPYDASRVASFITLLTLPISALREFLKLIAWEKGLSQAQGGDIATAQRARVELCLENHSGSTSADNSESSSSSTKSNIHHDRAHNSVDFALTFVLDPAHIPYMNVAGGAAWLPYCMSVRLGEVQAEGREDGGRCKRDFAGDASQGKLRLVAETMQRTIQGYLQQMRDSPLSGGSAAT